MRVRTRWISASIWHANEDYDHKRKLVTIPAYLVPVIIYSPLKLRIISLHQYTHTHSFHLSSSIGFIQKPHHPNENNGKLLWPTLWWNLCESIFVLVYFFGVSHFFLFFGHCSCMSYVSNVFNVSCENVPWHHPTFARKSQFNEMMMHLMAVHSRVYMFV